MTTATATISQIANDLVAHCKTPAEDFIEHDSKLWDKHFAENWTSIEGDGGVFNTRDEVVAKYKKWQDEVTCHDCKVEGPFVGQNSFSVIFDLDMESKVGAFPRMNMKEVAIYTVENGKIVKEEFCYQCPESC
jgi:SnoaL-like protein